MNIVFYELMLLGLASGILAGMFGIGGGVIIVPLLTLLFGFPLTLANGTSLFVLMLPTGLLAVIQYYKNGYISIKTSGIIAIGLAIGVAFGAIFAIEIPANLLKKLYGLFLLYVCYSFFGINEILKNYLKIKTKETEINYSKEKFVYLLFLGILAGVLSGLFGIGGGLVIVPFLVSFLKFDTKKAIGTSLGALLLPVALPGVFVYYNSGSLNLYYAFLVAIGLLIGAFIGAKITLSLSNKLMKRIYAVFLFVIAMHFIFEIFKSK